MSRHYKLMCSKSHEVNTDPQRRCYNGCHFSSETVWSDWYEVISSDDLEDLKLSMANFQSINPTWKYTIQT